MRYSGRGKSNAIIEALGSEKPVTDERLYTLYGIFMPVTNGRWQQVALAHPALQIFHGGEVSAVGEPAAPLDSPTDQAAVAVRLQAQQAVLESFRRAALPIVPVALSVVPLSLSRIERVLSTHRQRLRAAVAFLEGLIELDLQATWPHLPTVLKRIAATDPDVRAVLATEPGPVSPETQMRVGVLLAQALEQQRTAIAQQWVRALTPAVMALRTDLPAAQDTVVNLAALLRVDREESVLSILMELSRAADDELRIRTVGPLVPVSFATARVVPLSPAQIQADCRILGISETLLTEATVSAAYRRSAHRLHPDRAEEPDDVAFQQAAEAARRLRTLAVQAGGAFERGTEAEILELPDELESLVAVEARP